MSTVLYNENDTFRYGDDYRLNACVGNNGYIDLDRYYDGYRQATMLMLSNINNASFVPDSMVYPIVYSARHSLELFLKLQIHLLYTVEEVVIGEEPDQFNMNTHSISDCFEEFERLTNIDDRYEVHVTKLREYSNDFAQIDDTGETFRYPDDHQGAKHLLNLYCINLGNFADRYTQMCEVISDIECITGLLYPEYLTGSIVRGVSRHCIEAISKRLPEREDWRSEEFTIVKNEILEEYGISSRVFQEVLNFIQKHYEFASNIGMEIPLPTLTKEQMQLFMELYNRFNDDSMAYLEKKQKYSQMIAKELPHEAIASIAALSAFRSNAFYIEAFEGLYDCYIADDPEDIVFSNLLGFEPIHLQIEQTLEALGQISILSVLRKESD